MINRSEKIIKNFQRIIDKEKVAFSYKKTFN